MKNVILYVFTGLILYYIFVKVGGDAELFNLISLAGIFATFGSALLGATVIIEQRSEQRVKENVEILYKDIEATEPWKRWGFLNRIKTVELLNSRKNTMVLQNPKLSFDVGTHEIQVNLPTVAEDFFDLPIYRDYLLLRRYDKAFQTKAYRDIEEGKVLGEGKGKMILSFLCVKDVLKHACIYRVASLVRHFSIGLILFSIILMFFFM